MTPLEEALAHLSYEEQEDFREILRLGEMVKEIKEYGFGSVEVIIQDGVIVFAQSAKKWRNKGSRFSDSTIG